MDDTICNLFFYISLLLHEVTQFVYSDPQHDIVAGLNNNPQMNRLPTLLSHQMLPMKLLFKLLSHSTTESKALCFIAHSPAPARADVDGRVYIIQKKKEEQ